MHGSLTATELSSHDGRRIRWRGESLGVGLRSGRARLADPGQARSRPRVSLVQRSSGISSAVTVGR